MSLFKKVFEAMENSHNDGYALAAEVAGFLKDRTKDEGWYCAQLRTLAANREGRYCVPHTGKKHLHSETDCGRVAIVRI